MSRNASVLLVLGATLLAGPAFANLVPNGNFSGGNTQFTSEYVYAPALNTTEGEYTVRANAFGWNPGFVSLADHTGDPGGQYLVANGAPLLGSIVWQSLPIAVVPGRTYFFEAYVANVCCLPSVPLELNSDPVLDFFVSLDSGPDRLLGRRTLPASLSGIWFGLSTRFVSGSATTALLTLRNANIERLGNDFALDDVFLGERSSVVPAPGGATVAVPGAIVLLMQRQVRRRLSAR